MLNIELNNKEEPSPEVGDYILCNENVYRIIVHYLDFNKMSFHLLNVRTGAYYHKGDATVMLLLKHQCGDDYQLIKSSELELKYKNN